MMLNTLNENTECSTTPMTLVSDRFSADKPKSKDAMMLPPERKRDSPVRVPRRRGDPMRKQPERSGEFVRETPRRTVSLPKRTIWKDKGGSARYVLRDDEAKPEDVKPTGYGAAAKSAMTDALLSGSVAGLAVLEKVEFAAVATRRHLDRQWTSQKRISETPIAPELDDDSVPDQAEEGALARGKRGLLRRAKSFGSATGFASLQRSFEEHSGMTSTAA